MCISENRNYACGCFPGTGKCHKTVSGQKKKKCPDGLTVEIVQEKIKQAQEGHKVCKGRPVNKSVIKR